MNDRWLSWLVAWALILPVLTWTQPGWAEEDAWTVNLKEADIRAFVSQVSDITGKSFVVDPRVKGKVTVVSKSSMSEKEVYKLFLSVLNVHGFAAVPSGRVIKIVPSTTAKQDSIRKCRNVNSDEMVTCVVPIKNASAIELVPILRPLIPQYGHLAGVASANALIVTDHSSNLKRIMDIVDSLDQSGSEELEVIQLQDAWVGDVVKLLESLEPVETGGKSKRRSKVAGRVTVVAEERTNRLIVKGEKSARARVRSLVAELDKPSQHSGTTKVIHLNHAEAVKVSEILLNLVQPSGAGAGGSKGGGANNASRDLNIQADETLNALVIRAEPSKMMEIEAIVRQLDVRRAQVLIEAAIVEVSGDIGNALGVQWGKLDKGLAVGGVNLPTTGQLNLNQIIGAIGGGAPPALSNGITLAAGDTNEAGDEGYGALLQALSSASSANLLSTPSIMTLDNEEAEIVVGQNVPFITGSLSTGNNGVANPFQTISREDVGLTLKVIPQINEGDVIRLQVEQEVSSVVTSTEAIQSADLLTNKRSIKTTILAENSETIVLGGLIQDDVSESELKVPVLGDIPLLGNLFKSKRRSNVKRNLLVFLRPNIVRERGDAQAIADSSYDKVKKVYLELDDQGNFLNTFRSNNAGKLPAKISDLYNGYTQDKGVSLEE